MSLERLCRVGNDFPNLKEVILTAARMCREAKDWAQLNTTLTLLSKRRGQHSKAVTAMVQEVRTYRRLHEDMTISSALADHGIVELVVLEGIIMAYMVGFDCSG